MFQTFKTELPQIRAQVYDITSYGAVSGGIVSNTKAFADAIGAASKQMVSG